MKNGIRNNTSHIGCDISAVSDKQLQRNFQSGDSKMILITCISKYHREVYFCTIQRFVINCPFNWPYRSVTISTTF